MLYAIFDANLFPAIWDDPTILPYGDFDGWETDYLHGIFEGETSMDALDAFAERTGFAPYSAPENADAVYIRDWCEDGTTLGAIYCNSEVAVYPLTMFGKVGV